jgi:hypothetical protein
MKTKLAEYKRLDVGNTPGAEPRDVSQARFKMAAAEWKALPDAEKAKLQVWVGQLLLVGVVSGWLSGRSVLHCMVGGWLVGWASVWQACRRCTWGGGVRDVPQPAACASTCSCPCFDGNPARFPASCCLSHPC